MTIHLVFILLLLGHVLGDFYFQTDALAARKKSSLRWLLIHGATYAASMAAVLWAGIPPSWNLLYLTLAAGLVHLGVDLCRRGLLGPAGNTAAADAGRTDGPDPVPSSVAWLKARILILDQAAHLLTLGAVWAVWGASLPTRAFLQQSMAHLPARPVHILLCALCLLRPAGQIIEKDVLANLGHRAVTPAGALKNAARLIGYLERLIVFFFLLYRQYTAIAFILTAKSVARYKKLEENQPTAEHYLIGTFCSVVSVFTITTLLGLLGA